MATSLNSGEQTTTTTTATATPLSTIIQVPEYFYAVDVSYLSHMIGKK
jgi:hypothetical protein